MVPHNKKSPGFGSLTNTSLNVLLSHFAICLLYKHLFPEMYLLLKGIHLSNDASVDAQILCVLAHGFIDSGFNEHHSVSI